MNSRWILLGLLWCASGWTGSAAALEPRITEFLAANSGSLLDQDGDASDWIEIYNPSAASLTLTGWHLTDTATNLTRWTFPATNLPPNAYLVVFASGKNRAVPGAALHANFQLDANGEFLALVAPDGQTVVQSFSPAFPPQRDNISYGVSAQDAAVSLVQAGASGRFLAPADNSLDNHWTDYDLDDSNWLSVTNGLGFDLANRSTNAAGNMVLRLDFNDRETGEIGASNTVAGFSAMTLSNNPSTFNGITVALSSLGGATLDDRDRTTPVRSATLTQDQLYDDFVFAAGQTNGNGLRITISGLRPNQDYQVTIWSFDSTSTGNRISDWIETASGTTNIIALGYTFDGSKLPVRDGDDTLGGRVRSSPLGELRLEARRNGGTSNGVFLNALQLTELGLGSLISTDVAAAMNSRSASAYLRLPFTVADPGAFDLLRLNMQYNDGFAAYVNGQLVAARNAPSSLAWNSTALSARSAGDSLAPETIEIPNVAGLLMAGTNVLALQGLNISADDPDFLLRPELQGITRRERLRFFSPPTPGTANGAGYAGWVADTKFSVNRGFYEAPFSVVLSTATTNAQIFWTLNGSVPTPTNGTRYTAPVSITNTAFLRAAAYLADFLPTDVDTHTYIFLEQVLRQSAPQAGYPTNWQASYPADYGMDPNVVNDPTYAPTLKDDLRSIPTVSLVADFASFWHSSTGIYVNATSAGAAWERAVSAEMFHGDNLTDFHVNCGVRMQGNASRDNVRTPKHSFRLLFKSKYGPPKLNYAWFTNSTVSRFDNIILRAGFTDTWSTRYSPGDGGARYRPEDSIYLRDPWVKDTQADMGHLSARNSFVHLYVNGLYWGLYNPCERLDASCMADHLGGAKEDWDVLRDFSEVLDGNKNDWNRMMSVVNAGITNETAYQAVGQSIDVDNLIDYMLLHIYAEAEDWPQHNWYATHRRATNNLPATKWIFLAWDQEIVLDQIVRRNRIDVKDADTPAAIYAQLRAWPEFRRRFGDRVQKHLFNHGALSPEQCAARLQARANGIQRAVVGESARWGDAREFAISPNAGTGKTLTRDGWWTPEIQKLCANFFAVLQASCIDHLRSGGLYPTVGAPQFSPFGGAVPADYALAITHTNATGVIYYTMDGTDPRAYGTDAVSGAARAYSRPLVFPAPTRLSARVLSGGQWSALVTATFVPPQDFSKLILTELYYRPPAADMISGDEFEFVELQNAGTNTLDLTGLTFSTGIDYAFAAGTWLSPGQFFVLARNPAQFTSRFPAATVQGNYGGKLDNNGERITLADAQGNPVISVTYDNRAPWPVIPEASNYSLQKRILAANANDPTVWDVAPPTPGQPYPGLDRDGDGLPEAWEIANGTDPDRPDAGEDPDGDGLSNLGEFLAGTNPRDRQSSLKALQFTASGDGFHLEFLAVSNRTYGVLVNETVEAAAWTKFRDLPARPTNRIETLTLPIDPQANRFFRLVTPAQP
jgi:hypothetical protein